MDNKSIPVYIGYGIFLSALITSLLFSLPQTTAEPEQPYMLNEVLGWHWGYEDGLAGLDFDFNRHYFEEEKIQILFFEFDSPLNLHRFSGYIEGYEEATGQDIIIEAR